MRPIFVALIAAALPAFSYARPAQPTPVRETVSGTAPVASTTETEASKADQTKLADSSVSAANKPVSPRAEQKFDAPLCASPSVSVENPAATQNGLACKPVMWAGADTNLQQG